MLIELQNKMVDPFVSQIQIQPLVSIIPQKTYLADDKLKEDQFSLQNLIVFKDNVAKNQANKPLQAVNYGNSNIFKTGAQADTKNDQIVNESNQLISLEEHPSDQYQIPDMYSKIDQGMKEVRKSTNDVYENEAIFCKLNDSQARDDEALKQKTFKKGRFIQTKSQYDKWFCCYKQAAYIAIGQEIDQYLN